MIAPKHPSRVDIGNRPQKRFSEDPTLPVPRPLWTAARDTGQRQHGSQRQKFGQSEPAILTEVVGRKIESVELEDPHPAEQPTTR